VGTVCCKSRAFGRPVAIIPSPGGEGQGEGEPQVQNVHQSPQRLNTAQPLRLVSDTAAVRSARAFTLIELLVVIAVAGILAALAIPAIKTFGQSNRQVAATRQMLDAVGRARQLAIVNRTTVYMVFLPNGVLFPSGLYGGDPGSLPKTQEDRALDLAPGQGRAYVLISLRSVGDQPGRSQPRYLTDWTTLPQGWVFDQRKFIRRIDTVVYTNLNYPTFLPQYWDVKGFAITNGLPFPTADSPVDLFYLPYIAFDYSGQLVSGQDEYIPLARGTVYPPGRDQAGQFLPEAATITEDPPGNALTEYNLIHIDWLTGRARLEERKIE